MKAKERDELLEVLKDRFEKNMSRHKSLEWGKVQARLEARTEKLASLNEMESYYSARGFRGSLRV